MVASGGSDRVFHKGSFVKLRLSDIQSVIGEPQKNDLSDTGSWLLSFKGGM